VGVCGMRAQRGLGGNTVERVADKGLEARGGRIDGRVERQIDVNVVRLYGIGVGIVSVGGIALLRGENAGSTADRESVALQITHGEARDGDIEVSIWPRDLPMDERL